MKNNFRKSVRRWLALVMTAIMLFAVASLAMAADNNTSGSTTNVAIAANAPSVGTLSIANPANGATYNVYKVFSATVANGSGTYAWTEESAFSTALDGVTAEDIIGYNATQLKTLANTLETAAASAQETAELNSGNSYTTDSLALGYYLVVESGTSGLEKSQPILVAIPQVQSGEWVYSITVTPKSSSTDFTKKIAENSALVDTNAVDIVDTVSYRLYADIPEYEASAYTDDTVTLTFKITDTMSTGLTWTDSSSVSVYTASNPSDSDIAALSNLTAVENGVTTYYSVDEPADGTKGGTFTVTFTKAFLSAYKGQVVVIAFDAELNENAKIADEAGYELTDYADDDQYLKDDGYSGQGNPNGATLEYSNSYYGGAETGKIKDIVTSFTFELGVEKVDADSNTTLLAGAEFKIYTDSTCETEYTNTKYSIPLTSSASGVVTADGLDEGTYYLKETKAPSGYSLYDGVIQVVIVADKDDTSGEYTGKYTYTVTMDYGKTTAKETDKLTKVTVEDEKGLTMPGTGGIGTTIFTFGGLALVILAAIMFIVYTKKQRKQA
ncbi:MAG: SpaH/EbpB family LPXTG-anchored major pilin [Lachnospiraceae bacterium]|nr:SpaH/EbpB family LPXTG-anchored major pilin [Lachnospiraceae bacterium]